MSNLILILVKDGLQFTLLLQKTLCCIKVRSEKQKNNTSVNRVKEFFDDSFWLMIKIMKWTIFISYPSI